MMNLHEVILAAQLAENKVGSSLEKIDLPVSVTQSEFNNMVHVPNTTYIIFPDESAPTTQAMAASMTAILPETEELSAEEDDDEY